MTEFHPPIFEREKEELIEIAYSKNERWQKNTISEAKTELEKRKISEEEQLAYVKIWKDELEEIDQIEKKRLNSNITEGYETYEIIILLLFGPFLIIKPYIFNNHTLFTLRGEKYYLKFKQRIIIFMLSFSLWYVYLLTVDTTPNKEIIEEMKGVDISEWEKEYGYD